MAANKLTNVLLMIFKVGEKNKKLKVPNPRPDLTGKEVKAVMDKIASENVLWEDAVVKSASVVKTVTDSIDITTE